MTLNRNNYLKLCEVAWDISHDGSGKQVFLKYSPHVEELDLELYLNGWSEEAEPDTKYTLEEDGASYFSQSCDPDDIVESLQAMTAGITSITLDAETFRKLGIDRTVKA